MLFEVDQAANRIRAEVDPDANIIFGGTILENMEGRLRVSVVATGIEAEHVAQLPPNVEQLRPRTKAGQIGSKPEPRPAASPVHSRVEALAQEMNAALAAAPVAAQPVATSEPMMMRSQEALDAPEPAPEPMRVQPSPVMTSRPAAAPEREPEPEQQKRGRSIFGRWRDRKPEPPRAEPQMAPRAAPPAPPATRNAQPVRPASQTNLDDLFPEHEGGDIDIPAFLRRQTN